MEAIFLSYLSDFFQPDGPLASLEGYEYRAQQQKMADLVYQILEKGHIGIIEAGTGTGKSLAYLYPAICFALDKGEKVVISTNTINLQEQLLEKDIPVLKKLGCKFKAVVAKGWSNYPCWEKVCDMLVGLEDNFERQSLLELDLSLSQDQNAAQEIFASLPLDLKAEIEAESDLCIRSKCSYFNQCPVFTNRRLAEEADIVIVNHHLLLADVCVRQQVGWDTAAVLPAYQHIIFDEAHHLEDIATDYFGLRISLNRTRRLLGCFYRSQSKNRGILQHLRFSLSFNSDEQDNQDVLMLIDWKLLPQIRIVDEAAVRFFKVLEEHLNQADNQEHLLIPYGGLETPPILENYDRFYTAFLTLERGLKELSSMIDSVEEKDKLLPFIRRVELFRSDLEFLMEVKSKDYVYWLKSLPKYSGVVLQAAPIQVGGEIREHLLYQVSTAVFTSATLSVNKEFNYFRSSVGIDNNENWDLAEEIFLSPFDYQQQVYLGIAKDLPFPGSQDFVKLFTRQLEQILDITQGRAFLLFTSYRMMNEVIDETRKLGLDEKYNFLVQGEMPRNLMVDRFKTELKTVLLGTDSFWEGVDVAGEALSTVIITKLPFRVPTDPITAMRSEYIKADGRNPFVEYYLPQAVLKFRQGFGRLIRTKSDKGFILICDRRIKERNYGKHFLDSLPNCTVKYENLAQIRQEVKSWLS